MLVFMMCLSLHIFINSTILILLPSFFTSFLLLLSYMVLIVLFFSSKIYLNYELCNVLAFLIVLYYIEVNFVFFEFDEFSYTS